MKKLSLTLVATATAALASTVAQATDYEVTVVNLTRGIHFTPLVVAAHDPASSIFSAGAMASSELQAVAEGGDTASLNATLESIGANVANGDALLAPGNSATFTISTTATPANTVLSVVGMLLPTNDGFIGLNSLPLPTGDTGTSVSYRALGYDAGTEANDELVGSGAPGEAGFPAPPPIVASGTGTGGSGVAGSVEGFVHVHRNVLGDTDMLGGSSDINSTVHRWLNPVAHITVTVTGS
jgi:hypothetical protein